MAFKDNLLKKIEIKSLTAKVLASIGSPESGRKVDRKAMRELLQISGYTLVQRRQLDLYLKNPDAEKGIVLVLDNDLTVYDTTVDDVVMRKNPYIKEMLSIRNIIKILNDKDVVVSRKDVSVERIHRECLAGLDLSYSESDIADLALEGVASLESRYSEGVRESLSMFAELLGYQPPPKAFAIRHQEIHGALTEGDTGEVSYGPLIAYSPIQNDIRLIDRPIRSGDPNDLAYYRRVAGAEEKAPLEGAAAFEFLKRAVLDRRSSEGQIE